MSEALTTATTILDSAWSFISGNAILFGVCALGLLAGGVRIVKNLF